MDTITPNVAGSLQILICVSIGLILITGIFLIKLLIDTSNLVKSMQDFIKVTHSELEPAIKEFQGTLVNINSISSNVNNQINSLGSGLQKGGQFVSSSANKAYQHLKVAGEYTKEGLLAAINAFFKK